MNYCVCVLCHDMDLRVSLYELLVKLPCQILRVVINLWNEIYITIMCAYILSTLYVLKWMCVWNIEPFLNMYLILSNMVVLMKCSTKVLRVTEEFILIREANPRRILAPNELTRMPRNHWSNGVSVFAYYISMYIYV